MKESSPIGELAESRSEEDRGRASPTGLSVAEMPGRCSGQRIALAVRQADAVQPGRPGLPGSDR